MLNFDIKNSTYTRDHQTLNLKAFNNENVFKRNSIYDVISVLNLGGAGGWGGGTSIIFNVFLIEKRLTYNII